MMYPIFASAFRSPPLVKDVQIEHRMKHVLKSLILAGHQLARTICQSKDILLRVIDPRINRIIRSEDNKMTWKTHVGPEQRVRREYAFSLALVALIFPKSKELAILTKDAVAYFTKTQINMRQDKSKFASKFVSKISSIS